MQEKTQNRMISLIMLVAIAFTFGKTSQAAIEIVENALEATPRQIEWPTFDNGRLVVRRCRGCEALALNVTPETAYQLEYSGPTFARQELISLAMDGRDIDKRLVYVFYIRKSRQVTRIVLDMGPE
jgi:hypothetical protein